MRLFQQKDMVSLSVGCESGIPSQLYVTVLTLTFKYTKTSVVQLATCQLKYYEPTTQKSRFN